MSYVIAGPELMTAAAEAANAAPLAGLAALLSPVKLLTGRPLFGNGTDGAAGTGAPVGTAGGFSATAVTAGPVEPGRMAAKAVTQRCSATAVGAGPAAMAG